MTKFVLARPGAPWDYPTLGFTADADGAILDGTLFDPDLTVPPDAYWSVYGGGSAETNITRYATPGEEFLDPTPETVAGWLLAYDTAANTYVATSPDDVIATASWDTALSASIARGTDAYSHGALGNGVANDTVAIQAAIDAVATAGGGYVYLRPGDYLVSSLTLKAGVTLTSLSPQRPSYRADSYPARIFSTTAGAVVIDTDTTTASTRLTGIGVQGLVIEGTGVASVGIRFHKTQWSSIKSVTLKDFTDQGILVQGGTMPDGTPYNVAVEVYDVLAVNCLTDRTRASAAGAVEIHGGDPRVCWIEATSSQDDFAITDSNLYLTGILIGSTNGFYSDLVGEISDVGLRVTGEYNRFVNCRADLNAGHGWIITGTRNIFASCHAVKNGKATADTYSGFKITGTSNDFAACRSVDTTVKYGFEDTTAQAAASSRNNYDVSCRAESATAPFWSTAYVGSGRHMPPHDVHPAANSTSIDVTGTSNIVLDLYNAATTITALTGGVNGQTVTILATAAVPITMAHSATFRQRTAANRLLLPGEQATYRLMNGQWWEVDPGPTIRAITMTTVDVTMDLQTELVWGNNAATRILTLPRAQDAPNRRRTIRSIGAGQIDLAVAAGGGTVSVASIAAGTAVELISNGTNWYAIGAAS